jgi:hypothetical protein
MGEMENVYNILLGNLKRRDHLGDLGVGARVILKSSSKK